MGCSINDVHTTFLQDNTAVFVGDGTYAEGIVTRTQIGKTNDIFLSRAAPALIESFQLPRVQNQGRVVIVYIGNLQ